MKRADFLAILRILVENRVEFIVIGGVAAAIEGAPINTLDLDIIHRRTADNIARLQAALEALDVVYRMQPERRLRPSASHLSSAGRHLLETIHGPLDVLGTVDGVRGFEELLPRSFDAAPAGLHILVLRLETVIELKAQRGTDKDTTSLTVLRRTLEEKRKRGG